jgi:hydrogenase nickel incorporation protein HypB
MCATCGCSEEGAVRVHHHEHASGHDHTHEHAHTPAHAHGDTVRLEEAVLGRNAGLAEKNRAWFRERGILALNVVSSPGAGKTTLLVRTIRKLGDRLPISVIEGDQETSRDADRVRAAGAPVLQINTGTACHLDAHMVGHALETLRPGERSSVIIENVGNLICPALFDLGEEKRVLVSSVTEGEDKPIKYPLMFRSADAILLNKIDLLPHVEFETSRFLDYVSQVNRRARVFSVSATRGDGMREWYEWVLALAGGRSPL